MATVFFDEEHNRLVEKFSGSGSERRIFSSNYEFMVFAAMVGRHTHGSCEDVQINKGAMQIKDQTFGDKDGIAYLLALDGKKHGEIMRAGNENEVWKYIERYAYLGCEEIKKWEIESPIDDLHDVVLEKIMEAAIPLANVGADQDSN